MSPAIRTLRRWHGSCPAAGLMALFTVLFALACTVHVRPALALNAITVQADQDRVEITPLGEAYDGRGDSLTIETAASSDGVRGRMSVRAATSGTNPRWLVFALSNPSDKPIERWLTADRYTASGSGIVWPDLDARRLEAVTPSMGFVPSRVRSDRADIFALTLEPGQTITYVVELATESFPRVFLWKPLEYEIKARDRQLFNGVMLGLTVLAAIFLTSIFAANHKIIFPAAALFSWCVLTYLCVEFGFFHKLFNMKPEDNAIYRAAAEASMAASLVMFLHAFLRLRLSHGLIRLLSLVWILGQLSLVAVAAIDPRLAATFARISFVGIGGIGAVVTLFLAIRGQDRALHLVPTWILFLIWIFLAAVTLTGRLPGDVFVSALMAGLVMVVLLIAFTVTQFAFRSIDPVAGLSAGDSQLRAIAVDGARSAVWEWSSRRDEIKTGTLVEELLGLNAGELNVKVDEFLQHVHSADRERFRLMLWSVQERAGGKIRADFRMRHADNTYRWFELEAASVPTSDRRTVRCIGLMRDVTDVKIAHERLLHDAVRCSLTGVPNRSLLLDRLATVMARSKSDSRVRPTVFFIDIDKFKSVNATLGLNVGDSVLITVARRLQRHLGPFDTLARVGGDQFAILFVEEQESRELAALAERVRRSLRSPIHIASQEVVLTVSLGIAVYEGGETSSEDFLREAEIAMFRAKRGGTDRIEIFRPELRGEVEDDSGIEGMVRKAVDKGQLKMLFQPIVYLPTEELAGFEAMIRFEHPKLGMLNPAAILTSAADAEYVRKIGSMALSRAVEAAAQWQKELPRPEDHLFVNVDVASTEMLRSELAQEVRHLLAVTMIAKGTLRLEVSEAIVMENPEHAVSILDLVRGAGAEVVLDDFGAGYSSLTYLQRLACETFKIDRSLVRSGTGGNEAGSSVVRAMVALAHELGKKAIAEGIEAPDDVVFLRAIGCEFAQGFYYGEPMADRDVTQLLRIIRKSERKLQTHGFFKTKQRSSRKKRKREAEAQAAATSGVNQAEAAASPGAMPESRDAGTPMPSPLNGAGHPDANGASPPRGQAERPRGTPPPLAAEAGAPAQATPPTLRTRQRPMPQRQPEPPAQRTEPLRPPAQPMPPPVAPPPFAQPQAMPQARVSAPQGLPHETGQPFANTPAKPEGWTAPNAPPPSASAVMASAPPIQPPPVPPSTTAGAANGQSSPPHANEPSPPPAAERPNEPRTTPPTIPPVAQPAVPPAVPPNAQPARTASKPRPSPPRVRPPQPQPDFSTLPPGIAASLAKLAGIAPPEPPPVPGARRKEPTES
ncbi:MAG: EAL domain-containing protein [Hyphomicrobiaceae bacterium]|nr:EAL domain-containing protein [Hyphomicrobiaceae bacterium]